MSHHDPQFVTQSLTGGGSIKYATAGEQEWWQTHGLIYKGDTFIGRAFTTTEASHICKAINAALATERKKLDWWDEQVSAAIGYLDGNEDKLGNSELHRKLRKAFAHEMDNR